MHVCVPFVANLEPSKCMKPSQGTFDEPARFTEATAMRRADFGKQGRDAAFAQTLPVRLGTVASVTLNNFRFAQRTSAFSRMGGIASTSASSCVMSLQFAAVKMTASGMPCASTMRWCLLPSLRRSVGFGPVFSRQHRANRGAVDNGACHVELATTA